MFVNFSINRELLFKFENYYVITQKNAEISLPSLGSFSLIKFSKPRTVEFTSSFFPFLVLSNGSLIFVEFAFNRFGYGTLLFDDLYT
jgi:hypothetical protein